jgi:UDP-GlcNAc:undecaprenyl-phosphate/decaprenyl-phosphate GlcNAc-1-phosphate transferase
MIRLAPVSGLVVHPSENRQHRAPTPTAGGLAIFVSFDFAVFILRRENFAGWPPAMVFVGVLGAVALGFLDDAAVLRPSAKLGMEILVASFLSTVGPNFTLTTEPALNWLLTTFWLLTTMNAVNLTDGVDGLAGGLGAISASAIAIVAGLHSQWGSFTWAVALVGSIGGFLIFNASPARIFMGDTGALSIGAILGVLSIRVSNTADISAFTRLCLPILLMMVPLLDTMTVTVIRIAHGQPVSRRGLDHSHHRLRRLGLSDPRIVAVLCVLQLIASVAAVGLSIAPPELAVMAAPFVSLPFALVGLFITDQSFEAGGPGALQGLPMVARVLLSLGYKRRLVEVGLDLILISAAYFGAFMLRLNFRPNYPIVSSLLHSLPNVLAAAMAALLVTRTYRGMWRYTAILDALRFAEGAALSGILVLAATALVPIEYDLRTGLMFSLLLFNLLGLSRLSFCFLHRLLRTLATPGSRVLIVGADATAAEAAHHFLFDTTARRVTLLGLVDDDALKLGKLIHGCKILGSVADLDRIFEKSPFDELLLASPTLNSDTNAMLREFASKREIVMYRFIAGVSRIEESGTLGSLLGQSQPAEETENALGRVVTSASVAR